MQIKRASQSDIETIIPLFDQYRVFYKQGSNVAGARQFLQERLSKNESVIFLALDEHNHGIGFTQLFPIFSSETMQRTYILNDLFVRSEGRGKGVGEAILNKAKEFAIQEGSKGLALETDFDNPAQKLYERLGWIKDSEVFHYTWKTS
jgi:GNAT superfamily N-acetyltransferase